MKGKFCSTLVGQGEKYIKILLSRLFLLSLQADSDLKRGESDVLLNNVMI